jgi:iron complex transport system permease protein
MTWFKVKHKSWQVNDRLYLVVLLGLLGVLLFLFCLSLSLGSVSIPLGQVLIILTGGTPDRASWTTIVLQFRLPRAVTAGLAGAALAVSGLQMQTLFRNPLAGPFVLGINAGASLGVALVVAAVQLSGLSWRWQELGWVGDVGTVTAAGLGAAIALILVLLVARHLQDSMTLLILGLMIGYAANGIVTILLYFSTAEQAQSYLLWTFGSFAGVGWQQLRLLAPLVLIGLGIAQVCFKSLNLMLLDEVRSVSLGLNVQQSRLWIILSAALLAGTVTAFCGPIAFLGVAVPHLCRSLLQTLDHRWLVPATTILGASLALIADLIAQVPGRATTLPLNAVMALIGAPVITWLILKRRKLGNL